MQYIFQRELKGYSVKPQLVTVWNTESSNSFHEILKGYFKNRYVSSEYFGADLKSGHFINGVLHEDICNTSFPSNNFDFILSSDVLEHVPNPQKALFEICRVLKPGGKFIFTVPFIENMAQSDIRARLRVDGTVEYTKKAIYHDDPLRPDGILVYVIFGEDLSEMCNKAGLIYKKEKFYRRLYGIIGSNAIVLVAQKGQEF